MSDESPASSDRIAIDISVEAGGWPSEDELRQSAENAVQAAAMAGALTGINPSTNPSPQGGGEPIALVIDAELSILFTDDAHVRRLNARYRGKDRPTNVLSFPQASGPLLGDIILAFETVEEEARLAGKQLKAHMAHLIIHGFLHLLGYDHEGEAEAEAMEALERAALARIGIPDPYAAA